MEREILRLTLFCVFTCGGCLGGAGGSLCGGNGGGTLSSTFGLLRLTDRAVDNRPGFNWVSLLALDIAEPCSGAGLTLKPVSDKLLLDTLLLGNGGAGLLNPGGFGGGSLGRTANAGKY